MTSLRLLLLSTPVGPLGSGLGGGVELTVMNLAKVLTARGHHVTIAAPAGSVLSKERLTNESRQPVHSSQSAHGHINNSPIKLVQIPGDWQTTAQSQDRAAFVITHSALSNSWEYARQSQSQHDLLVNFAYDWLPFYLTPFFHKPVAHFVSMGSLNDAMDEAIARLAIQFPGRLGAYTRSQADTFQPLLAHQWQILGCALDLQQYDYCDRPDNTLAWVGRLSPEKGVEDAIAAAAATRHPLKIFGKIEDPTYWQKIQNLIAKVPVPIDYCGFLPTDQLQKSLGRAQALLMTPRWIEAFGIVAIEALACGVPVIAYQQGGPAEIVRTGETGWLVSPGDVSGLIAAITRIDQLDRQQCRQQAETLYSLTAWGSRFERWFYQILSGMMSS